MEYKQNESGQNDRDDRKHGVLQSTCVRSVKLFVQVGRVQANTLKIDIFYLSLFFLGGWDKNIHKQRLMAYSH